MVVQDGLGRPRGARRVVDERGIARERRRPARCVVGLARERGAAGRSSLPPGALRRRATRGSAAAVGSSPRTASTACDHTRATRPPRPRRCGSARYSTSFGRSCVELGITSAPISSSPTITACHSGTRGSITITGSPAATPSERNRCAARRFASRRDHVGVAEPPLGAARRRARAARAGRDLGPAVHHVAPEVEVRGHCQRNVSTARRYSSSVPSQRVHRRGKLPQFSSRQLEWPIRSTGSKGLESSEPAR